MTVTEQIRKHLQSVCNYKHTSTIPDYATLYKTQWCPEFEKLMRNRLIMGFFRYGDINKHNTTSQQKIASIKKRIGLYEQDGNLEHLVDIANLALVEFMHSEHPQKHFQAQDDVTHVVQEKPILASEVTIFEQLTRIVEGKEK